MIKHNPSNAHGQNSKRPREDDKKSYDDAQIRRNNILDKLRKNADSLTYEDSLNQLDALLVDLQNDKVKVEELQMHYLQAKVYLEHCEELLKSVEQEVLQIDLENS